jgi:DNA-binding NarL/FixJ family response regulator
MASGTRRLRVLLVQSDRLVLRRLMNALDADQRVEVVGYAYDGEEAVDLAVSLRPDVILMATHMPGIDGAEATRRIRTELPQSCVLLTSPDRVENVARAHEAGAAGFIREDRSGAELIVTTFALAAVMAELERTRRAREQD